MDQFLNQIRYEKATSHSNNIWIKKLGFKFHQNRIIFEETTSLLVAAGPESTLRLRSTTQLRRGASMSTLHHPIYKTLFYTIKILASGDSGKRDSVCSSVHTLPEHHLILELNDGRTGNLHFEGYCSGNFCHKQHCQTAPLLLTTKRIFTGESFEEWNETHIKNYTKSLFLPWYQ